MPRARRRSRPKRRVVRRRRMYAAKRSNPVRRRRRSYRRRRNPVAFSPVRRRRRSRRPSRSYRRRRNPALTGQLGMSMSQLIPLAFTGAASSIATVAVPRALGLNTRWSKYAAQAAVAVGGGVLVSSILRKPTHGGVWAIVGLSVIVADAMREFVLSKLGLPGLSAYPAELAGYPSEYYLGEAEEGYPVMPEVMAYDSPEQIY